MNMTQHTMICHRMTLAEAIEPILLAMDTHKDALQVGCRLLKEMIQRLPREDRDADDRDPIFVNMEKQIPWLVRVLAKCLEDKDTIGELVWIVSQMCKEEGNAKDTLLRQCQVRISLQGCLSPAVLHTFAVQLTNELNMMIAG